MAKQAARSVPQRIGNWLAHRRVDAQLAIRMLALSLHNWRRIFQGVVFFAAIAFLLQWLFNLEQLRFILTGDNGLDMLDKIDVLIDGFFNLFKLANDLVPIAIILIAMLQSAALLLLLDLRKLATTSASAKKSLGSLAIGLLGSGCVACGGSVLTPLLSLIATNVSISLAETVGDILLVFAVLLSYSSCIRISFTVAQARSKTRTKPAAKAGGRA